MHRILLSDWLPAMSHSISDFVAPFSGELAYDPAVVERFRFVGVAQQTCTAQVDGGWSSMLRIFLDKLLLGPSGFEVAGVPLPVDGRDQLLFARLTNLLSDGDGHRLALDWRGASGLKPCFKHWSVFKKDSNLASRKPGFVEIDCSSSALFRSWTCEQLYQVVDGVAAAHEAAQAGTITKAMFEDMTASVGLNFNPRGLLSDTPLRYLCVTAVPSSHP